MVIEESLQAQGSHVSPLEFGGKITVYLFPLKEMLLTWSWSWAKIEIDKQLHEIWNIYDKLGLLIHSSQQHFSESIKVLYLISLRAVMKSTTCISMYFYIWEPFKHAYLCYTAHIKVWPAGCFSLFRSWTDKTAWGWNVQRWDSQLVLSKMLALAYKMNYCIRTALIRLVWP